MTNRFDLGPVTIDLHVIRGDTTPWTFTLKDSAGAVIDVTGFSFLFTVDISDRPTDATNNVFQLTGSVAAPTTGVVQFEMSAAQADQTPGTLYYDFEQTDAASKIRTLAKGRFIFRQDITK